MEFVNFSQAADNNKLPILTQLKQQMTGGEVVLEIGSGSGQHALHFASAMPEIVWQPSDQGDYYPGLRRNLEHHAPQNVRSPIYLDLSEPKWPADCDVLYAANVVHIMPAALLPAVFQSPCNRVLLYGPFKYDGEFTTDSNASFDRWLKGRNALSGIRDIELMIQSGAQQGYQLMSDTAMPANNQFLVFRR